MKMEKKIEVVAAAALLVFLICSQMEMAKADATDCLDACQTACVNPSKPRETQRCEAKCQIRCGPASSAAASEMANQVDYGLI